MKKKIIVLAFIFYICFTSCVSNEMPEGLPEKYKYLKNNMIKIDITDDSFSVLADFNESVRDYDIFFTGEYHAVAKNYDIIFYLLKNFNQNHGVRYILLENGFAEGQILNKYLQSGDKNILDATGAALYAEEAYEFYVKVYEYNKTLPENKKLTFVGIDLQPQAGINKYYLFDLLAKEPPREIANVINQFKELWDNNKFEIIWENDQYREIINGTKIVLDDMGNKPEIYKEYLGDEYFSFMFACENILQTIACYKDDTNDNAFIKRENYMRHNFDVLYEYYKHYGNYGNEKYYGNFGNLHARLKLSAETTETIIDTVASFIDNDHETTKGKTLSISFIYSDSMWADTLNDYTPVEINGGTYNTPIGHFTCADETTISFAKSLSGSDFTLFDLTNDNSPFIEYNESTGQIFYTYGFQYYLLIQNSPAVTKMRVR